MEGIYYSSNLKQSEEKIIIKKAASGDKKAFSRLYEKYNYQIQAFCRRMLHKKQDLDDVVQQVFMEAWRSLKNFEGRSLFSTWLTKIAIHTCISARKKNFRLVFKSFGEKEINQNLEPIWSHNILRPDQEVFLLEKRTLINKLLSKMTMKKKLVFILADMQGLTAPEISKILNIPDATIRTRLFHARRDFAHLMNKNQSYKDVLTMDH